MLTCVLLCDEPLCCQEKKMPTVAQLVLSCTILAVTRSTDNCVIQNSFLHFVTLFFFSICVLILNSMTIYDLHERSGTGNASTLNALDPCARISSAVKHVHMLISSAWLFSSATAIGCPLPNCPPSLPADSHWEASTGSLISIIGWCALWMQTLRGGVDSASGARSFCCSVCNTTTTCWFFFSLILSCSFLSLLSSAVFFRICQQCHALLPPHQFSPCHLNPTLIHLLHFPVMWGDMKVSGGFQICPS